MKKLIYKISGHVEVYNFETCKVEQQLSLAEVTVEDPTEEEIALAEKVSYNGEYTIEDDGRPSPENAESGDVVTWNDLDAAYQEGVDSL